MLEQLIFNDMVSNLLSEKISATYLQKKCSMIWSHHTLFNSGLFQYIQRRVAENKKWEFTAFYKFWSLKKKK